MTTISSANNGFSSFIYNDQYFGHALMVPAFRCWEKINEPFPLNSGSVLTDIVSRGFALVGLVFSSALFVPGLVCKSIDYMLTPLANSESSQAVFTQNTSNAQTFGLSLLAQDPSLAAEAQKLGALRSFADEPSQPNYYSLPIASRYLVAGRYTYPVTSLWSLSTRAQLMEKLEEDFSSTVDAPRLVQAAREAFDLQEKILFAKILLKILERGESIEPLARVKPQIFTEIKECLWKGYGSPRDQGSDFGGDVLRLYPNTPMTQGIINQVMHLWGDAYYNISHFDFRLGSN